MSATVIKGAEIAQQIRTQLKEEVEELKQDGLTPHLTVILVGDDPASISYVTGKEKAAKEVGISSEVIRMPENTPEVSLLKKIHELNEDENVHGILVQLPLPEHIDEQLVIEAINPNKDVDGFHPINIGRMMTNKKTFLPCTPYGIIEMLKRKQIDLVGKHAVVIGRSNIVGKPIGQLLLNENATVTYCHSKTENLQEITNQAEILIVAVGKPEWIDASYVKDGAVVIDVGVNRTEKGLIGDVCFDEVKEIASYITPVPRGVGPMTITMLLVNTVQATKGLHERA